MILWMFITQFKIYRLVTRPDLSGVFRGCKIYRVTARHGRMGVYFTL